ncbi:hypothetical protein LBUL_0948 [Lactobacillus delbrueckii subsp. bulgaricus ATCC BAA-365]|nr:hypothetical protein LBUL_0948 [Lactobacillus delbrueckii subsp. bulgaricus ATCC BAA-365]CDR73908.1 Protein of unknown function [Lactobacillus delbrueckii subsp. bulgaricus]CDR75675.1 Protein of unknown function [Lactobacillus delbrueckii subsp. bulgaricus]
MLTIIEDEYKNHFLEKE